MKILISVLSLNKEPYVGLEKTIRETWGAEQHKDVEVIYYYGDYNETNMEGDRLFLDSPEGLMNVGHKTLKMYEYVLGNYDFDYIYRTNSSSYINIPSLKKYLEDKNTSNFYNGIIGNFYGINFASGSGYCLSRDLVEYVINHKNEWDHTLIDDVSLGKLLTSKGISITPAKRFDVTNTLHINLNHYHYRVKNNNNRSVDIDRMNKIHKLLGNA